jgi:hypothetical protein
MATRGLCLQKLEVSIRLECIFSDLLFSILHTPLALVPVYYRYESVVAKLISLLISLGTVGNYLATPFFQYLPYRKNI